MLRVERRVLEGTPTDVLSLPYDERKRSRLMARSERGFEVAIVLERGSWLRDGDMLAADNGEIFLVRAAAEAVTDATTADAVLLAKAAYHLGNRHVPLQIELAALRYQQDHVLDAMVQALGLQVTLRTAAFEPEGGAYAAGHHGQERTQHDAQGRRPNQSPNQDPADTLAQPPETVASFARFAHSHGPGEPTHEH